MMAPFAVRARVMLMEVPTPVADLCAGYRAEMLVTSAALHVS